MDDDPYHVERPNASSYSLTNSIWYTVLKVDQ